MNLHVSFIYKNTLWERGNFTTDVIETKQQITEVKYDAVQWIIHDKLTYYLIVQRDQRIEIQRTICLYSFCEQQGSWLLIYVHRTVRILKVPVDLAFYKYI